MKRSTLTEVMATSTGRPTCTDMTFKRSCGGSQTYHVDRSDAECPANRSGGLVAGHPTSLPPGYGRLIGSFVPEWRIWDFSGAQSQGQYAGLEFK